MANVRAFGKVLDETGSPVVGTVYFYKKTVTKDHYAVRHEDSGELVGPGTELYEFVDKECDSIPGGNAGFFDLPGGIEPGEYALHVHCDEDRFWAWPFVATDGTKPQDVYIGGSTHDGGEGSGEVPVPGNYPAICPLDRQFTKGNFVAAFSYYGMFGAPLDRIKRDFDKFRRAGFGHARVWVDWEKDRSPDSRLTTRDGDIIEEKAKLLDSVLAFCQQIGMSLDLTFETAHYNSVKVSGEGYKIEAHKKAVRNVLTRWGKHPCIKIVDVDNEAESRGPGNHGAPDDSGKGHTSAGRFAELMAVARSIPHTCLVSCSISGDGEIYKNRGEGQECIFRSAKGDILLPHMARKAGWGAADGPKCKALSQAVGLPWHSQEPARNNYNGQNWPLYEFENSFKSNKQAGAFGCCFHGDFGFDVSTKDAFDQMDVVELQVVSNVVGWIK